MTETQAKFVELDKKKAEYKLFLEEYRKSVNEVAAEIGIGGHFVDAEGIVYQVAESDGRFIYNENLVVKRTKREGERAGSLSLKKAQELGYEV